MPIGWHKNGGGCCGCSSGTPNQNILIQGCVNIPYPGVTVSVYTASGGTLIDAQITDGSGIAHVTIPTLPGTYWVEVTGISTRFNAFAQSRTLNGTSNTIGLAAASGYVCNTGCCLFPIAGEVTLTDSEYGSFLLTYDSIAAAWVSVLAAINYPGCTGCPPAATAVAYTWSCAALNVQWRFSPVSGFCPGTMTFSLANCQFPAESFTCPEDGALDWSWTTAGPAQVCSAGPGTHPYLWCGGPSFAVTE